MTIFYVIYYYEPYEPIFSKLKYYIILRASANIFYFGKLKKKIHDFYGIHRLQHIYIYL